MNEQIPEKDLKDIINQLEGQYKDVCSYGFYLVSYILG